MNLRRIYRRGPHHRTCTEERAKREGHARNREGTRRAEHRGPRANSRGRQKRAHAHTAAEVRMPTVSGWREHDGCRGAPRCHERAARPRASDGRRRSSNLPDPRRGRRSPAREPTGIIDDFFHGPSSSSFSRSFPPLRRSVTVSFAN